MFKKTILVSVFFLVHSLFSQTADVTVNKGSDSPVDQNIKTNIDSTTKTISSIVQEIENTHDKLMFFTPGIDKEMKLETENLPVVVEDTEKFNIVKQVIFGFEGKKLKSVKVVTRKLNLSNQFKYTHKFLSFDPSQLDSATLIVKTPESLEKSTVKDYYPVIKLKVLKLMDSSLESALNQMVASLRKNEKVKENKESKRADF